MHEYNLYGCIDFESEPDYQTLDKKLESYLHVQNETAIHTDRTTCKRTCQEYLKAFCSTKEMTPRAITSKLNQSMDINLKYDDAYTPNPIDMHQEMLMKVPMHGDSNLYWRVPQKCFQCNKTNTQNTTLHETLHCLIHQNFITY